MGDKINKVDEIFQTSLANHEVNPKPEVWDRLSEKLDKKEKTVVFIWWKWAAAAAVVILSIWLMYPAKHQETKNIATNSPGELETTENRPVAPPTMQSRNNAVEKREDLPKIAQPLSERKSKENNRFQPDKRKTTQESFKEQNNVPSIDREPEVVPPALANVNQSLDNSIMTPEMEKHDFPPYIPLSELKATKYKDYKVKIISNGYAIQPEKEKLVGTLENKIGGFFSKLDEGFGDLQDAKNNLFASLTTKRDKKNN